MPSAMLFGLFVGSILSAQSDRVPVPVRTDKILVVDRYSACMVPTMDRSIAWDPDPEGFTCGARRRTRADIEAARATLLASEHLSTDVLAEIGITPTAISTHWEAILKSSDLYQWIEPGSLPKGLERTLSFENLKDEIARFAACCIEWRGTTRREVQLTLPGNPRITVTSKGSVGWMLPWTVVAGDRQWTSSSIEISKVVLPFVDEESLNRLLLDGTRYWADWFWEDAMFWMEHAVEIDQSIAADVCSRIPGYSSIQDRFRIDWVEAEEDRSNGAWAMEVRLSTLQPAILDHARWQTRLVSRRPEFTWKDFLASYESAARVLQSQVWISSWKEVEPDRHAALHASGKRGWTEKRVDLFALPAWKSAGLRGEPQFEIWLERDGAGSARAFFSPLDDRGILVLAVPVKSGHWFDELDLVFSRESPWFGILDPTGLLGKRRVDPWTGPDR